MNLCNQTWGAGMRDTYVATELHQLAWRNYFKNSMGLDNLICHVVGQITQDPTIV